MIAGIALAGAIVTIPLYSLATLASFFAARLTTACLSGQSSGLFDHSFTTFLLPTYLLWSFLQAIAVAIAVMLVHTYYGYNAKGSPVGVGREEARRDATSARRSAGAAAPSAPSVAAVAGRMKR